MGPKRGGGISSSPSPPIMIMSMRSWSDSGIAQVTPSNASGSKYDGDYPGQVEPIPRMMAKVRNTRNRFLKLTCQNGEHLPDRDIEFS